MHITIDTSEALTAADKAALRALIGDSEPKQGPAPVAAPEDDADEPTPAPAKKATPAKKTAAKKAAPKPDPEPEPEDDDVDPLGDDDSDDGEITMATAVELATKLVSEDRSADVKAALAEAGVKRVSELKGDAITEFVTSLRD